MNGRRVEGGATGGWEAVPLHRSCTGDGPNMGRVTWLPVYCQAAATIHDAAPFPACAGCGVGLPHSCTASCALGTTTAAWRSRAAANPHCALCLALCLALLPPTAISSWARHQGLRRRRVRKRRELFFGFARSPRPAGARCLPAAGWQRLLPQGTRAPATAASRTRRRLAAPAVCCRRTRGRSPLCPWLQGPTTRLPRPLCMLSSSR